MKYLVTYEHRSSDGAFSGKFEFESEHEPEITDANLIDQALQNSKIPHMFGVAGLSITSISLLPLATQNANKALK